MSAFSTSANFTGAVTRIFPRTLSQGACWYAIQTRSRHEKVVAHQLESRGVAQYAPMISEIHRWSDRRKRVERPLFPGYVFVRIASSNEYRVEVLRVPGVLRFVGSEPCGTAIPDDQIESVKALVDCNLPWSSHPFLKSGQRVRVRGGALEGVEGIFLRRDGADSLIVSIDAIQRSLAVSIQGYGVEPI